MVKNLLKTQGVQAVPYRVIDTWGKYSIVVIPPIFTIGLLIPSSGVVFSHTVAGAKKSFL
jgi:hypothetical protein